MDDLMSFEMGDLNQETELPVRKRKKVALHFAF
jgi:hypothetical protein